MQREFVVGIQLWTLVISGILSWSLAAAQTAAPPSLEEQLKAQYQVVKMGSDANGLAVVQPGTVLAVQKGGILGFPPKNVAMCPSTYKDGSLHGPNGFCVAVVGGKENTHLFQIGEKVYPTKIDVNVGKERISFFVIECDSCNGVSQPSFYKSEVVFQFPKEYLETAGVSQVEDAIGQVLTVDQSGDQAQQQAQDSQPAQQQVADQPQAPPQTIQLGQTLDQVVGVLGQPQQIVNLGAKQIYVYKHLKVTLLNGKVSDVE